MKCPHCLQQIHSSKEAVKIGSDCQFHWFVLRETCPACTKLIVQLHGESNRGDPHLPVDFLVYPKGVARTPLPVEIPARFAEDYSEACLVLKDSPKASAALSRRCLQNLLIEQAKVTKSDLSKEIDQVLAVGQLPSYLAKAIDALRNLGNFAAHPIKSKNTGEIVEVEEGETEWLLDVLEGLFDFYFVRPEALELKRKQLNQKLKEAGKPEMK